MGKSVFWFDNWTEFGPLIVYLGESCPSQLRLHNEAKVCDAIREGSWFLPHARSDRVESILIALASQPPPTSSAGNYLYFWKSTTGMFLKHFPPKELGSNFGFVLQHSFGRKLFGLKRLCLDFPSTYSLHSLVVYLLEIDFVDGEFLLVVFSTPQVKNSTTTSSSLVSLAYHCGFLCLQD